MVEEVEISSSRLCFKSCSFWRSCHCCVICGMSSALNAPTRTAMTSGCLRKGPILASHRRRRPGGFDVGSMTLGPGTVSGHRETCGRRRSLCHFGSIPRRGSGCLLQPQRCAVSCPPRSAATSSAALLSSGQGSVAYAALLVCQPRAVWLAAGVVSAQPIEGEGDDDQTTRQQHPASRRRP